MANEQVLRDLKEMTRVTLSTADVPAVMGSIDVHQAEAQGASMEPRVTALEFESKELKGAVSRLEVRLDRIDTRLDKIEAQMSDLRATVAKIDGRLDLLVSQVIGKLPTWWQMPTVMMATAAVLVGLLTLAKQFHLLMPQ